MDAITTIKKPQNKRSTSEVTSSYYAELIKARDLGDLNRRIRAIITRLEFSDYSFYQLSRSDIYQPALCTLPQKMMKTYFDESLFTYDMTLQKAIESTEPFFRSTLDEYIAKAPFSNEMIECMNCIFALNRHHGYYDYYHIPVNTGNNPVMLSVAQRGVSPVEFRDRAHGRESALALLCEAIHGVLTKYFATMCYPVRKTTAINPKPLRVLQTLANSDSTIEQVAKKLCISVVTANQHLKTVRASLGVKTNYAAIKRSVSEGLIRLDTPQNNTQEHSNGSEQ